MSKIDFTKAIETVCGTPAVAVRVLAGRAYVRIGDSKGRLVVYKDDGTHVYGVQPALRNVAEEVPAVAPTPALDLKAPLQTADGKPVEFLGRSYEGGRPLAFRITYPGGHVAIETRYVDGRRSATKGATSGDDIVNKPVDKTEFRNVYSNGTMGSTPHRFFDDAKMRSKIGRTRIGILAITTRNGVFLSSNYTVCQPYTRQHA